MKKTISYLSLLFIVTGSFSAVSHAEFLARMQPVTTVKDVYLLPDETPVELEGKILTSLGDEKYTFTDDTGTIVIEIDDDELDNITVTPEDKVHLFGELDKNSSRTEIDVKKIEKR